MDPSVWLNILLVVLVALAIASRGFRVDDDYIKRWATSAGLELTNETRRVVRRYLVWSRRSRTAGGLAGVLVPGIYLRVTAPDSDPGGWIFVLMIVGYLLGALFAEVVVNRPWRRRQPDQPDPRPVKEYLPAYVLVLQRGLTILIPVFVVAYALLAPHSDSSRVHPGLVAAFGSYGVCIAIFVEWIQRSIVSRRTPPALSGDEAVADAMKASSVRVVAGAGLALLLNVVGPLALALLTLAGPPGDAVAIGLMFVVFPVSILLWLDLGKPQEFRVRRRGQDGVLEKGAGQ
jgi:hypothetical protein